jgi:hypothetical protein
MNQPMSQSGLENLAEKLERLSVQYIQDKNWTALERMLDPACQFVGMDGACDRESAMTLMKAMNLGPVKFKGFKITQSGDNLVVSFWLAALEYQDGKELSPDYSPRLSIWKMVDGQYLCIAYADLITQKSPDKA